MSVKSELSEYYQIVDSLLEIEFTETNSFRVIHAAYSKLVEADIPIVHAKILVTCSNININANVNLDEEDIENIASRLAALLQKTHSGYKMGGLLCDENIVGIAAQMEFEI